MIRAIPLSSLTLATVCLVGVVSTSNAQDAPVKATAKEVDDVAAAYLDTFKSKLKSVEDTWIVISNDSSRTIHNVWIEYYTCDGEHGYIDHPNFETISPGSTSPVVDATKKIRKCRLFWIVNFGPIPFPFVSTWEECDSGKYMWYARVNFPTAYRAEISPTCVPCQ